MDNNDLIGGLLALALLWMIVLGGAYGTYRYGKFVEKRALFDSLENTMNTMYWDGYSDRIKSEGVIEMWEAQHNFQLGYRKAQLDCDDEPLFSGRY